MSKSWSVKHYHGELDGPFYPALAQYSMYPFNDLPNFELHVPYHFVIANTGKKLYQLYGLGKINFDNHFSFLKGNQFFATRMIMMILHNIYVAWNVAVPDPKWLTGEEYNEAKPDSPVNQAHRGGARSDG